jgi:hypothetical protein
MFSGLRSGVLVLGRRRRLKRIMNNYLEVGINLIGVEVILNRSVLFMIVSVNS